MTSRNDRLLICVVAVYAALWIISSAPAGDWPMLDRNAARNAVTPETNPPVVCVADEFDPKARKWTRSRNVNGNVQVIAPQGDRWLCSVDALMGESIWKFDLNSKTLNRLVGALIPLAVLVVFWLVPIPLGASTLQRKGYSPRWMWFGILPIAGWLVLLVAVFLAVRPETTGASSIQKGEQGLQEGDQASVAYAQYEKGMKELGTGLIVLGVLQALVGIGLLAFSPSKILGLVIVNLTALNIYLGVFARKLHAWVNYVVAVLACVLFALNLINQLSERPKPGSSLACCAGFVIPGALLYYSVNNIQKLIRASAAAQNDDTPPNE